MDRYQSQCECQHANVLMTNEFVSRQLNETEFMKIWPPLDLLSLSRTYESETSGWNEYVENSIVCIWKLADLPVEIILLLAQSKYICLLHFLLLTSFDYLLLQIENQLIPIGKFTAYKNQQFVSAKNKHRFRFSTFHLNSIVPQIPPYIIE